MQSSFSLFGPCGRSKRIILGFKVGQFFSQYLSASRSDLERKRFRANQDSLYGFIPNMFLKGREEIIFEVPRKHV